MHNIARKSLAAGLVILLASCSAYADIWSDIKNKVESVPIVGPVVKGGEDVVKTGLDGTKKGLEGLAKTAGGIAKCIGENCEQGKKDIQDGFTEIATGAVEVVVGGGVAVLTAANPVIGVLTFGAPSPLQGIAKFIYDTVSRWKGHPDCNPQEQMNRLMTVPKKTLGDGDRLAGVASTPAKYISSIFDGTGAWEPTGCDGSGIGIPIRDGQISTDGFWTVDLQLLDFDIQGLKATAGHFIRLEIIPGTPAHASASTQNPKPSDVIRFSGPMIWDKDKDSDHPNGHMEVHPYGELIFGVHAPTPPPTPPPPQTPVPPPTTSQLPTPTAGPSEYKVEKGNCLSKIAEHFYGDQRWPIVFCANRRKIKNPDLIYPGQEFRLPLPGEEGYGKKCLIPRQ